jgi:Leucine-rich repeat (LRR) protein
VDFLAPPQADDELGRLGKHRVLKVLGHGGMGVVYLAEDTRLKRLVAIKAMLPALAASASAGQRFLREAQAMAAVKHDHVVTVHQVDEERSVPFLVMELLQGEPLDKRLRQEGKLPLAEVLRIGREIAEGLEAAHTTGLIHRDVKPANVFLEAPRSRVKILDFGLARAASGEGGLTQQGAIVGTPGYMAPEQARGESVDARSDLFSLGVVLYRLCTGQMPFRGADAVSTLVEVATHQPPAPSQVSPGVPWELSDLVMRLLEKDPHRRPATAGEVVEVLRALEGKAARHEESGESPPTIPAGRLAVPAGKVRRLRRPLLLGLVLAALLPLAWWLAAVVHRVGSADAVEDRPERTLEPGGKVEARVPAAPPTAAPAGETDRKAAEWALSLGGKVMVAGEEREIAALADLPRGSFRLTMILLAGNKQVSDAGLANVEGCKNLRSLNLFSTPVSDAGLAHLKGCKDLSFLELGRTRVGDAGMAHLEGCKSLTELWLEGTQVGDRGLAHFRGCKGLVRLSLWGTPVSDAGLAVFKDCKGLTHLYVNDTKVGDAGLAHFKGCKALTELHVHNTQVSDVGLAHFKDCKGLTNLNLEGTRVGDLTPLRGLPLKDLRCDFKPPRDAAILRLIKTLETINGTPARDFWSEVDAPRKAGDADRKAAEHVLSIGGTVRVQGQERVIKAVAELPRQPFQLVMVGLFWNKQASDAGLASFKGCKHVTWLSLGHAAQVGDRGLAHFKECKGLTSLNLNNTQVTDAGLAFFRGCKDLNFLELGFTRVGDAGMAHFKDCKSLTELWLQGTQVGDAGLAHFQGCKELKSLSLWATKVSDAGLAHFKDSKELTHLYLNGTQVDGSGLAHLAGCKNLTVADLQGTQVGDAGLAHLKDYKSLTQLNLWDTKVSDAGLAHVKDCKSLTHLNLEGTKVSDLSPLRGLKLTTLYCRGTKVTDLSPLKGMPLKELHCDFKPERDAAILRSIRTLETINGRPARDFWKGLEARKP